MKLKYRVIERFREKYSVSAMCRVLEVSRSGYYDWRKRIGKKSKKQWLVDAIAECQKQTRQTYGYRRVRLWIQKNKGKNVNSKAILKIMRNNDMLAQIRRKTPYIRYKRDAYKYNNLLNRKFAQERKNCFWATDITYIPTAKGMVYLCAVIDLCGHAVLSWKISENMSASLVTDTVRNALKQEKVTGGLTLHSDRGSQYTSQAYHDLSQEYHFRPSMSSPGCPYDNAAVENFFGVLKTECIYRASFTNRKDVVRAVSEYIAFYNNERINLKNGLTPNEIRSKAA